MRRHRDQLFVQHIDRHATLQRADTVKGALPSQCAAHHLRRREDTVKDLKLRRVEPSTNVAMAAVAVRHLVQVLALRTR